MGRKRVHRTLRERLELYSRASQLRDQGLARREIARTLDVSVDQVSWWLRGNVPAREEYVPDLRPTADLAYLVGAYLGDGRTAGERDKKVRFKLANVDFANRLNTLVAKTLGRSPKPLTMEEGFYCVDYDCAALYDFLQQPLDKLAPFIEHFEEAFLRGFFDAEGYVSAILNHKKRALYSLAIGVANSNLEYLSLVRGMLDKIGISTSFKRTNLAGQSMTIRGKTYTRKRDVHHLVVNHIEKAQRFREIVGFSVPEKKTRLEDLLWLLATRSPQERYEWFVSHHQRVGLKWVKVRG